MNRWLSSLLHEQLSEVENSLTTLPQVPQLEVSFRASRHTPEHKVNEGSGHWQVLDGPQICAGAHCNAIVCQNSSSELIVCCGLS